MITVAGEALIDLIVDADGHIDPRPGGGPFNVARAVARLGQPAAFCGRLSADRFGQVLRDTLDADGVRVAVGEPAEEPTTLAVADIDQAGVARYRFYLAGTSAAALTAVQLPDGTTALHIGSLGLVMEPIATTLEQQLQALPGDVLVMLDPNCRPSVIADRRAYLDRIARVMRRVDVLKTSTEDLAYLGLDCSGGLGCAAGLDCSAGLGRLAGVRCMLVTDGAAPVRICTAASVTMTAPVPPAEVADTVGAGDAFGGAFLAWWTGNGLTRSDLDQPDKLRAATVAAIEAAVVACTRRGAEPPWAAELAGHAGWEWLAHRPATGLVD